MIVSLSWVRNEEDIIEWFVRHHAGLVDRMILIDGSDDRTPAILRLLQREGFPLDVRSDPTPIHRQDAALTALLPECLLLGADWILPLDADEFLCAAPGRDVRDILAALPQDRVTLLPWRTYVPTAEDDPREPNPIRRICFRREPERPLFHKVLLPAQIAASPGVRLGLGSHVVFRGDGMPFPAVATEELRLAHLPVRSALQIRCKILGCWPRLCANPARKPNDAYHWRTLYEQFSAEGSSEPTNITKIACTYAARPGDPLPALVRDPIPQVARQAEDPRPCFLAVWLGPFLPTISPFLASCRWNPAFTWLLITDQPAPPDCPSNVRHVRTTAEELARRCGATVGVPISFSSAYRLGDLRPAFGEVFAAELAEFTHWGHCDLDVIWGDIGRFFTAARLREYDVLSADAAWVCGPCALYRRMPRLTTLWRCMPAYRAKLTRRTGPLRRMIEEADFARVIAEQPYLRVFSTHAQCSCFDTTTALWRRGRLWRSDGREALLMHLFNWKCLPIAPPHLHRRPAWRVSAEGIREATPWSRAPRCRRERYGVLTMADPATFHALLRLAASLRRHGERRIAAFHHGLSRTQRLRCLLRGIRLLPMSEARGSLPVLLRQSPFPMTLWLDPQCIVLRPLTDLWMLLQGRPHAAFERRAAADGSVRVRAEDGPSLAVIGFLRSRGSDCRVLVAWEREIAEGKGERTAW
ncbi:glycosyltransferase family 2 protein, partial [Candidatus Peregrinibacteria bacterium]|nr:glycosyltransferase family 2 protein [Candidatus Peregrinibacteria bacterium]